MTSLIPGALGEDKEFVDSLTRNLIGDLNLMASVEAVSLEPGCRKVPVRCC